VEEAEAGVTSVFGSVSGTMGNAMHFQAFLLDGSVRWNENRAAAAAEGRERPPTVAACSSSSSSSSTPPSG